MPLSQNQRKSCGVVYTGPTIWRKTPDMLKQTKNLNTFKHNLKKHYLKELKNSNFH